MREQYNRLIDRHDRNLAIAYKICQCNTLKHDLCQDAYLKILELMQKGKIKGEISSGYFFVTVRNLHIDQSKSERLITVEQVFDVVEDEHDQNIRQIRQDVSDAMQQIPYLHREVLYQHQEKSQRQLSRETGVCRDRLRMYKNKALEELEAKLKDKGYE